MNLSTFSAEIIIGSSSHCCLVAHRTASYAGGYTAVASINRITQKAQPLDWLEGKTITSRHRNKQNRHPSIFNLYEKSDRSHCYIQDGHGGAIRAYDTKFDRVA